MKMESASIERSGEEALIGVYRRNKKKSERAGDKKICLVEEKSQKNKCVTQAVEIQSNLRDIRLQDFKMGRKAQANAHANVIGNKLKKIVKFFIFLVKI